jgi:hypothetical protein
MKNLLVSLLVVVLLSSCGNQAGDSRNVSNNTNISKVITYGHGVYYFDSTGAEFGNSLAGFLAKNPEFEVTAIAGNGTGAAGATVGYFVCIK